MTKLTLEQKRLQKIKQQLFGKEDRIITSKISHTSTAKINDFKVPFTSSTPTITQDSNYLKKDLAKIGILTAIALFIQLLIYFLIQKNLINFNFSLF